MSCVCWTRIKITRWPPKNKQWKDIRIITKSLNNWIYIFKNVFLSFQMPVMIFKLSFMPEDYNKSFFWFFFFHVAKAICKKQFDFFLPVKIHLEIKHLHCILIFAYSQCNSNNKFYKAMSYHLNVFFFGGGLFKY